jgi:VWFA-related protein
VREELEAAARGVKPLAERRSRQIELTREWPPLLDEGEAVQIANEDPEAIKRAVTRACSDDPSRCYARMGYLPPDDEIRSKARRVHGDIQRATMETLTAINALASGLAKMPGSKTIVFLSDGFVTQQIETTLRTVVGQAARAGARVYAIDVRGLNRGRGAGIIDQRTAEDPGGPMVQFDALEDGPNSLAVDTGGLMIRNENNIGRALETIATDSGRYYVLGYQPQDARFDGTFRAVDVRVRRPGLRVRARRGYLALEPSRLLVPAPITTTSRAAERAPAKEAEAEAAPAAAPPAVTETGTVASEPGAAMDRGVRLRPDAGRRIEELSAGELASADALAKRGWEAYQRGDVEAAIGPLAGAAARPDVRPWVLYTLGLSQAALGRAREAAASWERVREAAPDFSAVYIDLADTYVQLSDATRALDVLRDAERRWPRDPDVHNAIGVIHVRRGALDDAIEAFSRAAAAAPSEPLAYFNLGRAYELRFARGQRFVSSQRRWTSSDEDRRKAAEAYGKYLAIGGPYATQAAEALGRLEWAKKP